MHGCGSLPRKEQERGWMGGLDWKSRCCANATRKALAGICKLVKEIVATFLVYNATRKN